MSVNVGQGDPCIAEAVAKYVREMAYVSSAVMATEVGPRLGRKLAEIFPPKSEVVLHAGRR